MRIAMVAPLIEPVPPLHDGTELVVSLLTEELVRRGYDVTLFASADSRTAAHLAPCSPRGLRFDPEIRDEVASTMVELGRVYERAADFDLIHNHIDYYAFPFTHLTETPTLTTAHGRFELPEVCRVYGAFPEQRLVSISDGQRAALPNANWVGTVFNGIALDTYHFHPDPGDYLVFLGRISPEQRPDHAIAVARELGMRLVMAAVVDPVDQAYHEYAIQPLIAKNPLVEFIGEVTEREKDELLGGAYAYLSPLDGPEPLALTMAEAMATGTPIVAYHAGAAAEVIVHGVTGFVCESLPDMIAAVPRIASLDRHACRARAEECFSPAAMADAYERVYRAAVGAA